MSITLRFTHELEGTLTNVTSAVLSDPTGTYGVKRDDTDATVVADGTAMTNVSTGIYQYTFTEPASSLTYSYYVEWVYSGNTYREEFTYVDDADSAISSSSDLSDALAQYNDNLDWEGDATKAQKCLAAIRWLLVNRPLRTSKDDHSVDFDALKEEKKALTDYLDTHGSSINRSAFVRGKMRYE